jgi:hypothetical protein
MTMFLTALIGFATLGHICWDSARSFAALAKENAEDEGNDAPTLYLSRRDMLSGRVTLPWRPQLSSTVVETRLALVQFVIDAARQ